MAEEQKNVFPVVGHEVGAGVVHDPQRLQNKIAKFFSKNLSSISEGANADGMEYDSWHQVSEQVQQDSIVGDENFDYYNGEHSVGQAAQDEHPQVNNSAVNRRRAPNRFNSQPELEHAEISHPEEERADNDFNSARPVNDANEDDLLQGLRQGVVEEQKGEQMIPPFVEDDKHRIELQDADR